LQHLLGLLCQFFRTLVDRLQCVHGFVIRLSAASIPVGSGGRLLKTACRAFSRLSWRFKSFTDTRFSFSCRISLNLLSV
jgi:hypothetical protein